jgi:hypothetical protein
LTERERAEAEKIDIYHVPQWEGDFQGFLKQPSLFEVYAKVGYAEGEKKEFWDLPGHGRAYVDCGTVKAKGCDHVQDHPNGKVFGRYFKRNCRRKTCPTCFEGWATAEAVRGLIRLASFVVGPLQVDRIIHDLKKEKEGQPKELFYKELVFQLETIVNNGRSKPIHVVLSPPIGAISEDLGAFQGARNLAYQIAKQSGLWGGACFFHSYRLKCSSCGSAIPDYNRTCSCGNSAFQLFFSPHFHIQGFGWIRNTKEGFERHGWVVKNLGIRKSVFWTFQYLLSHAGVSRFHTVTWFGKLSYNKLKNVPILGAVRELCPFCGRALGPLVWIGGTDRGPPHHEYDKTDPFKNEFFGETSDWRVI